MGFVILGLLAAAVVFGVVWGLRGDGPVPRTTGTSAALAEAVVDVIEDLLDD